jgi:SRSO17 transposase
LKLEEYIKLSHKKAVEIIEALLKIGFNFDLVLADSLYGESPTFLAVLDKYKKHYLLAIRSNHARFTSAEQKAIYEGG